MKEALKLKMKLCPKCEKSGVYQEIKRHFKRKHVKAETIYTCYCGVKIPTQFAFKHAIYCKKIHKCLICDIPAPKCLRNLTKKIAQRIGYLLFLP
jgi:hypothetical protein